MARTACPAGSLSCTAFVANLLARCWKMFPAGLRLTSQYPNQYPKPEPIPEFLARRARL